MQSGSPFLLGGQKHPRDRSCDSTYNGRKAHTHTHTKGEDMHRCASIGTKLPWNRSYATNSERFIPNKEKTTESIDQSVILISSLGQVTV